MPKSNPKRSSAYARYYRRAKNAQFTEHVKDRTPLYYGLAFVGIIVVIIVVVYAFTSSTSNAVTTKKGDDVDLAYIGTFDNGTIFDHGTLPSEIIGNNQLLPYFDQNLVSRTAGQPFSFSVPPSQGYQSPQLAQNRYQLYGETLHFQVTITKVLRDGKVLYPTS
ncbi:MAG TPA: FKBP-type peptidyl-prolyl cis-trans isomerase [Candidatus Lokiarchaeia archaeon]|nr:FKBP-type peptidyl-prolyl cis-trans isomerase [Candidatus Lokiarchaeia archaeon]